MSRAAAAVLVAIVAVIAYGVGACGAASDRTDVSELARAEIIGTARVAHQAEEVTQGKDPRQVLYLVLDVGVPEPKQAVQEETRRLESAGWHVDNGNTRLPVSASSDKANAAAGIYTLDEFLAAPHSYERTVNDIRQKFADSRGLIVVSVEPRTLD